MSLSASSVNQFFSIFTIIGQVLIVSYFVLVIFYRKGAVYIGDFIGKHGMAFAFVVALIATLGSLFFSEIANFEPCKLCWFQRIFMYPQVVLFAIAFWKKDHAVFQYAIPLSIIGFIIALYHYSIQVRAVASIVCTPGITESCATKSFMNFGYVSIPMMSLTAFLLIIFIGMIKSVNDKKVNSP